MNLIFLSWTQQAWRSSCVSEFVSRVHRFKRIWRRTHLISRRIEDDDNSGLAFFLLFWTFSLGFFLCFCFFGFIPLPLVPKVKGQQRWRLVAVGFFLASCSAVPLLSSPCAAQFSFLSPSVSFYSPCSLSLPLCLVFLLSVLLCVRFFFWLI